MVWVGNSYSFFREDKKIRFIIILTEKTIAWAKSDDTTPLNYYGTKSPLDQMLTKNLISKCNATNFDDNALLLQEGVTVQ